MAGACPAAFIGRETNHMVAGDVRPTRGDRASIALIGSDPGIAGTRLVGEFVAWAHEQGTPVLAGGCPVSRDGDLPFAPITEALRTMVRERPRDELVEVLGSAAPDLARLLPDLASIAAVQQDGSSSSHARLFEAFLGVLERLGAVAPPLVLVLEDLQWADPATRETSHYSQPRAPRRSRGGWHVQNGRTSRRTLHWRCCSSISGTPAFPIGKT
jgi:hypothetical protein